MGKQWSGIAAVEGEPTGDGRMIERGALVWEDGPWALIWDRDEGDHSGMTVGFVAEFTRDGDLIMASGELSESEDPETIAAVNRTAELLEEGAVGVSILMDDEQVELRIKAELLEDVEETEDGEPEPADPEVDDDGRVVLARYARDDMLEVLTHARIRHLAIVDTAAIADAKIGLIACIAGGDIDAFADPGFGADGDADPRLVRQRPERPGETAVWGAPLTVTDDGRIFGHAALWGRCHAGFANQCVTAPRGNSYVRFLHGEAVPGLATGPVTIGTTHADLAASATEAMAHYADSGRAVADVRVGEDTHGVWVAGRLRPGVSEADVAELRGSSLSGDWRPVGGRRLLVGLLAVNSPGFLVERADADPLVAAITVGACDCPPVIVGAAHGDFSGAVIALLPSESDADRVAVDGFEPPEALHLTLAWLGDADDYDADARSDLIDAVATLELETVTADAFAVAVFNPAGDDEGREPAGVLLVQDDGLAAAREAVAGRDRSDFPVWFPHVTVGYEMDDDVLVTLGERVGPITFDRVAVAFGSDDVTVLPLAGDGDGGQQDGDASDGEGEASLAARVRMLEVLVGEQMLAETEQSV